MSGPVVGLGLFSGGLDSILACRVLLRQGIRVVGLKFVTPFFDYDLLARAQEYGQAMHRRYGIEVVVVDISPDSLHLLAAPVHGFGRYFNPCIDCKIMMLRTARGLMAEYGASFLFTGEVLGQRPMSQRRDAMRIIERDSGCEGILLRPLCARLLPPSRVELDGLVDREQLLAFSGRGRKDQLALAAELGISDYPNPAGGCMLTDPNLSARIRQVYEGGFFTDGLPRIEDIRLLTVGRQFRPADDTWCILGRDERENARLEALRRPGDWLVRMVSRPGPSALVRPFGVLSAERREELARQVAGLVVRYGKKEEGGRPPAEVLVDWGVGEQRLIAGPVDEAQMDAWRI
ncbi:MAG: thiamine biosynthesis protein [Desulfobulbus sp.]|jgi:tRNA-specific 2-thiouridylase